MIRKIERRSVSDEAFDEMKRLILNGEWREGERIPSENVLTQQMGVSRVSIRSAIQKLSALGLVESVQGGGTYVRELDGTQNLSVLVPVMMLNRKNQIYVAEFRRIIESEATYLAAERATDEEIRALWENWSRYRDEDLAHPKSEAGLHLDVTFHLMVAKCSKNPLFEQLLVTLEEVIASHIRYIWEAGRENTSTDAHAAIIRAIAAHQPAVARQAMWDHMDYIWHLLKENADAAPGASPIS